MNAISNSFCWRSFALICCFVLLLRLPFLNQAIQGDDVYYLAAAQHAQIEPLHPNHAVIVFLGQEVSLRGHPHPPLNGWILGALLALVGDIREVPFHAAYVLFSLIAALAMWSLARRFSERPMWATLLFLATPAFVVNGNSLESDLPFLAFWMLSAACFVKAVDGASARWLAGAVISMAPAALVAMQSIFLAPVLGAYLWMRRRNWRAGWLALCAAPAALALWQLSEKLSGAALPASELAGHLQTMALQTLAKKAANAVALTVHLGWIIFPPLVWWAFRDVGRIGWIVVGASAAVAAYADPNPLFWLCFATGVLVIVWCARRWREFEAAWILLFFACALAVFFAGSARYLLPLAAPLAILVSRQGRWLPAGFAVQVLLGLALSYTNYQHWDAYREFAESLPKETDGKRVWINGEWGLQYYGEARGGLALKQGQAVRPGEYVLSSELGYPTAFTTGGGVLTPIAVREIRPALPLRLIGLQSKSAYSTASAGFRAFDVSNAALDRVRLSVVVEREPTLSDLQSGAPEADSHIVSGVYALEGRTRWMAGRAVLLLKRPDAASVLRASVYIPDSAPARRLSVSLDGVEVASTLCPGPGMCEAKSAAIAAGAGTATVAVMVDKTFQAPNDRRELGVVLAAAGFIAP